MTFRWCLPAMVLLVTTTGFADPLRIEIDARDLPRRLLSSTVTIPLDGLSPGSGERVPLWYPKWVPGIHNAGGPIQNLAGLTLTDEEGREIEWRRDPGEFYRFWADVPSGTDRIVAEIRYITNQPSVNSDGADAAGSDLIGLFAANTVLLYHEAQTLETEVETTLRLPEGWSVATALPRSGSPDADETIVRFDPTTLRTLVDSPFLAGRYRRTIDLNEAEGPEETPPHHLHLLSESEEALEIDDVLLDRYRRMVSESTLLFDTHPFDEYHVLLGASDVLNNTGLEHLRSSLNVVGLRSLEKTDALEGWERYLVPHEYVHAWCGKYRRPAAMATNDLHTPKETALLWVYEGLTQYLGKLIEVRCGLAETDEFVWYVRQQLRQAKFTQGRGWRSVEDTAVSSPLLRAWSKSWGLLRRSQDYYTEGSLFWLEVDARIRDATDDERSIDDFCRIFFGPDPSVGYPRTHDRGDVVDALEAVAPGDWSSLIEERIETTSAKPTLDWIDLLGYTLEYTNEPPEPPGGGGGSWLDLRASIGASFSKEGNVGHVLLDSPADRAGLAPGMRVHGVDGFVWSKGRMEDAIKRTVTTGEIELLTVTGDSFATRRIEYDLGPRYLSLVRDEERRDRLAAIAAPLSTRPVPGREDD